MIESKVSGNLWTMGSVIWWLSVALSVFAWLPSVILGTKQELLGNIAFAFLISAAFADAAVIASYWLGDRRFAMSRVVWLLIATVSLAFTLVIASQEVQSAPKDASTVLTFIVLVLSFPAGLLAALIVSAMPAWLGQANMVSLVFIWLLFVLLGYLQWFRLIPALLRNRREKQRPANSHCR